MNSGIPKLSFAELPASISKRLKPKYERLGYLGEFFARTAHQEEALAAFIDFTDSAKGELDMRVVELIALTVASLNDIAYERNQHERLSVRLGFGRQWVEDVERLEPEQCESLDDIEKRIQRLVIDSIRQNGRDVTTQLNAVVSDLGHKDATAILMVMARYHAHALMVNCLGIGAPVPSIFEDGFDA